ncbi:lysine--tRNA ligase [Chryseobacterium kwangjuense]|uniref:Lysine--tRNA ligase n=1 Tax=Chryseobacterium kwangjuense TaxID=267125 RepID=A0ABW9K3L4_9FLAO
MQLSEQEIIRREKLNKLTEMGINAFPAEEYIITDTTESIKQDFSENKQVKIAGRLMSRRIQGKASFAELQDSKGKIQVYFNRDEICPGDDKELYNEVYKHLLDIGDIIGIEGTLFTTQVGEMTILVKNFVLLTKALRPLPQAKTDENGVVHDGFTDPELRYRQRYVDLTVNPQVKEIFVKRTKLFNAMRTFFNDAGYFEVETPILQSIPGGAAAKPFITHHNALDIPLYLRIANELYLKRLIVGGFDGVYEFSKNFRNEGMDRTHNPEFTAMEIYVAYKDYNWMMAFTEKLLEFCAAQVNGGVESTFGEHTINWTAPYPRVSMTEAIQRYTGFDITGKTEQELFDFAKSIGIDVNETMGKGKLIDEIFGEKCEGNFIQPTFITDYPVEMSPLTKKHRSQEGLTERFELMVCGKEIANAYSELNDPIDQRERFESQMALSERGDDEAMFIDQDFLRALEYGMPPTAGLGIGMDRLIMFLTNNPSIQEVLFFPQMRPEKAVPQIELGEDEKVILEILNSQEEPLTLAEVKDRSQLSGKKWDKASKTLTKNNLVKVEKIDEVLLMKLA